MHNALGQLSLSSSEYPSQVSDSLMPKHFLDLAPISKIDCVILRNFKSFKDQVYVGPFLNFTSIIGPNGSGKSNILEALIFCFCSQKHKHSYFDVRDFINREGTQNYTDLTQENKKCKVEVRFQLKNGAILNIARQLDGESNESFYIDFEECSRKVYETFLLKNNINPLSANYAIWQGEIDKLILKTPVQLTAYVENLSSSVTFKKEYEDIKNQLDQIATEINVRTTKSAKLKTERKNVKYIKQSKDECMKIEHEYEQSLRKLFLAKVLMQELKIKEFTNMLEKKSHEEGEKVKEINEKKAQMQKDKILMADYQRKAAEISKNIAAMTTRLKAIEQPNNLLQLLQIKELKQSISAKQTYAKALQIRYEKMKTSIPEVHSEDVTRKYMELYSKWQEDNLLITQQLNKKKADLLIIERISQSKKSLIDDNKDKAEHLELKNREIDLSIQQAKEDISATARRIQVMKIEMAKNDENYKRGQTSINDKKTELISVNNDIAELETLLTENVQSLKDKQILRRLITIDGFKGILEQNVQPTANKYQTCFSIMMKPVFKYLLCTNEAAAKAISTRLRQIGQLKTLVILQNLKERTSMLQKSNLQRMAVPAIDVIDYDKSVPNLTLYLREHLDGKIICEDLETAYRLREKRIKGVKTIYTIDGNMLGNDGIISSYGNADSLKKIYKYKNMQDNSSRVNERLQELTKQKIQLEEEIKSLSLRFSQAQLIRMNMQITKMEMRKEEKQAQVKRLGEQIQKNQQIKVPKNWLKEMSDLEKQKNKIEEGVKAIQAEIGKSRIFSEFLKGNNISNIGELRNVGDIQNMEVLLKERHNKQKEMQQVTEQLNKVRTEIGHKVKESSVLEERIRKTSSPQQKQTLQANIAREQQQLIQIRDSISKIMFSTQSVQPFVSEVAQLKEKLSRLKDNQLIFITQTAENMGVNYSLPLDYRPLEEILNMSLDRLTQKRIESVVEEVTAEKEKIQKQLENFNTLYLLSNPEDDEHKIENQLATIVSELREMQDRKNQLTVRFEEIKAKRRDVFKEFLGKLKPILTKTYELLTENSSGLKGKVDIYLQNEEFPFENGLYFSPTPPSKHFVYDMQQLSGGEKAVASLALQYSLALTTNCSFLILDETDAFLDASNVDKFARLIQHSLKGTTIQFILITHKYGLFSNSASLVGVARPPHKIFSQVYSLELKSHNQ